jgi:deoxycytidylate deaminase
MLHPQKMVHRDTLESFNTYGWKPNGLLSDDENYMDLVLLVTRSSKLKQGSMACLLVTTDEVTTEESASDAMSSTGTFYNRIVSASTNQSLYKENESDIHAEIAAIGQAARAGRSTDSCTAYITMPPCRKCFAALLSAGVRRIVSRHASPLIHIAAQHDIEMKCLERLDEQRARVDAIVLEYMEALATEGTKAVDEHGPNKRTC